MKLFVAVVLFVAVCIDAMMIRLLIMCKFGATLCLCFTKQLIRKCFQNLSCRSLCLYLNEVVDQQPATLIKKETPTQWFS